jgi:hypothetical protein
MITIHNLEVRFEIDGEGDEAVFARLFERHMRRWQSIAEQQARHEHKLARERAIVSELYEGEP